MAGIQRLRKGALAGVYLVGMALYFGLWIYLLSRTAVGVMIFDGLSIVRTLWGFVVDVVVDAVSVVSGNGSPYGQRLGTGALGSVLLVGSAAFCVVAMVAQVCAAVWKALRERRRGAVDGG
ncbi:hypothetical protein [Nonomuraea bangladeshensis]|uniref:hypothetical protein n=1 Tax=Nonomuraea bangladeshensis TaxID=404385 RepID=UPI003C2BB786